MSFFELANSLTTSVKVSLVNRKEMKGVSDSQCLEECFSEALRLPGISRFHCIEPQGDGSLSCRLYSLQSLDENRPPEVYPYESDDTDSESFGGEISEDDNEESEESEESEYDSESFNEEISKDEVEESDKIEESGDDV